MITLPFITQIPAGISFDSVLGHDVVQMIIHAGPIVKLVLLALFLFSIISWAIIFVKYRLLQNAKRETADFMEMFWERRDLKRIYVACEDLRSSPVARLFRAGYGEFNRLRKIQSAVNSHEVPNVSSGEEPSRSEQVIIDNLGRSLK